jgi:hypothetical protein
MFVIAAAMSERQKLLKELEADQTLERIQREAFLDAA